MFCVHFAYFIVFIAFLGKSNVNALIPADIVIVILDQKDGYHIAHTEMLRKNILEQADAIDKDPPQVILSHDLNINGSWTIIPLLEHLYMNTTAKWFFFCLENTVIRLNKLVNVLSKFNENKDLWIGHSLYDEEPTIIHHFAMYNKKFKYPHIASGFAITSNLLTSLVNQGEAPKDDFSIDAEYEFAQFVSKITGTRLLHVPEICIVSSSDCATYPSFFHPCGSSVASENMYFAVKTCEKYHANRIPIIKKTWAKYVANIGYFSDTSDKYIPNAFIVSNTTQGHCAKTYDILVYTSKILKKQNLKWLIISDDDTLFSVSRLLRLLTCYNPNVPLAIGERYGFRVWDNLHGYDYLTGGAGVVLSTPLVNEMVKPGRCNCPSPTTPDDMYLFGVCLARIGVPPVHSPMFHQARPSDYATGRLASQEPVSFHKFWMIEPKMVYNEWFAEADKSLIINYKHSEL